MSEDKYKNREDYLLEYEKKIIDSVKDGFKNANNYYITVLILSIIVLLTFKSYINDTPDKMNLSKNNHIEQKIDKDNDSLKFVFFGIWTNIDKKDFIVYTPIVIFVIYILMLFQIFRILTLDIDINKNTNELSVINENNKSISINNFQLFSSGILGLIFFLQVKIVNFSSSKIFDLLVNRKPENINTTLEPNFFILYKTNIDYLILTYKISDLFISFLTTILIMIPVSPIVYIYFFNKSYYIQGDIFSYSIYIFCSIVIIYFLFSIIRILNEISELVMESYLEQSKKSLTYTSDILNDIEKSHIKNNIDLLLKLEKLTKDKSKESRLTKFINTGEYKEIFERISNLSSLKFEINKSNEAEKYIINFKKEYEQINKYVINWNEYSFLSYLKKLFKR